MIKKLKRRKQLLTAAGLTVTYGVAMTKLGLDIKSGKGSKAPLIAFGATVTYGVAIAKLIIDIEIDKERDR